MGLPPWGKVLPSSEFIGPIWVVRVSHANTRLRCKESLGHYTPVRVAHDGSVRGVVYHDENSEIAAEEICHAL